MTANCLAALAFAGSANAADMPVKAAPAPAVAAYSWTGFYVGANVGGGWGSRSVDYTANDSASAGFLSGADFAGFQPPPVSFDTSGVIGGLQLGYNWQFAPNWLAGLEADFDWSGIKGSGSVTYSGAPLITSVDEHIKWFGTVRGRLGYLPAANLLAYITGGFAYGRVEHAIIAGGPGGTLSSFNADFGCAKFNVARAGVNYRF